MLYKILHESTDVNCGIRLNNMDYSYSIVEKGYHRLGNNRHQNIDIQGRRMSRHIHRHIIKADNKH